MKHLYGDCELLKLILEGNEDAFAVLYQRYCRQLFYISLKYTGREADAEDIVQEVFSKIWCFRQRIKPDQPFIPYIVRIAKNSIFNRSKRRLIELSYLKNLSYVRKERRDATEEIVYLREFECLVKSEINRMPPKRRQIFILSRESGLSNKEIAIKLNISTSTVENQINKGLKTLKEKLKYSSYI